MGLKNDGLCWIHVPTEITNPILTEAAAAKINTVHIAMGKQPVAAGQRNPYYDNITHIATAPESAIDRSGVDAACGRIHVLTQVELSLVDLVVAVGGEVEGLPVFFELTADPATVDCPFSTTTPKEKWSTWGTFGQSHIPVKLGANWYRSSSVGESGRLMNASQWATLSRSNTISLAAFQAIQKQNQVGP